MTEQQNTTEAPAAESSGPVFFESSAPRTRTIPLKWPFHLDGIDYREVTIRRINGFEAKSFFAATVASWTEGVPQKVFPGLSLSQAAWDTLDDDDVLALEQAIEDSLPARFRPLTALIRRAVGVEEDGEPSGTGASSPA